MEWLIAGIVAGLLGTVAVFFTEYKIQISKAKKLGEILSKRKKFLDKIGFYYLFVFVLLLNLLVWSCLFYFIYYGYTTGQWVQVKIWISLTAFIGIIFSSLFIYWLKVGYLAFWRSWRRTN